MTQLGCLHLYDTHNIYTAYGEIKADISTDTNTESSQTELCNPALQRFVGLSMMLVNSQTASAYFMNVKTFICSKETQVKMCFTGL